MKIVSLGLDLSLTATGCVLLSKTTESDIEVVVTKVCRQNRELIGLHKALALSGEIVALVENTTPNILCIEGYAYSSQNIVPSVELGVAVKIGLIKRRISYTEVPPTRLKKYVCGNGNAKKELVLKSVYKRWGFDTNDNNLADAFGLACIGLVTKGVLKATKEERKALGLLD